MICEGASLSREKNNRDADQKYRIKCNPDHDPGIPQFAEKGCHVIGWLADFDILGRKFGLGGNRTKRCLGTRFYVSIHLASKLSTHCPNIGRLTSSFSKDMISPSFIMVWYELPLIAIAAYFAGSIPLGQVLTSVLRSTSSSFGARSTASIRVAGNISKGCAVVSLGHLAGFEGAEIAAMFVVLGHVYPVHCQFRGGNGTATLLGALIALHPMVGLVALLSWLFAYYVYRYASLSAVVSAGMTPVISELLDFGIGSPFLLSLAALVIWRNRKGLERVAHGTEKKVTWDQSSQSIGHSRFN